MNKPVVSLHGSQVDGANTKRCYMIHVRLHGVLGPSFRLAVLSNEEHSELKEAMCRMQIGSAPRLKEFYILPQPPVFDDVDKVIADIVAARHEPGYEPH